MSATTTYDPEKVILTAEELTIQQGLVESWFSTSPYIASNSEKEREYHQKAARKQNSRKKRSQLTIRAFDNDLLQIKKRAEELGIPYHTLITALLHNFATGKIDLVFQ